MSLSSPGGTCSFLSGIGRSRVRVLGRRPFSLSSSGFVIGPPESPLPVFTTPAHGAKQTVSFAPFYVTVLQYMRHNTVMMKPDPAMSLEELTREAGRLLEDMGL